MNEGGMPRSSCAVARCITGTSAHDRPAPTISVCSADSQETQDEWLDILPTRREEQKGSSKKLKVYERHFDPELVVHTKVSSNEDLINVACPTRHHLQSGRVSTIIPERPMVQMGRQSRVTVSSQHSFPAQDHANQSSHNVVDASSSLLNLLNHRTYCTACRRSFDGPCFQHTKVRDVVFNRPCRPAGPKQTVPLATASLPAAFRIVSRDNTDYHRPPHPKIVNRTIFTKRKVEAGTVFGPLVAPLIHLEEAVGVPVQYVFWLEEGRGFQAYDLCEDHACNWIKFIQPAFHMQEVNVMAYQFRDSIHFVAVRDIPSDTELRVFVKLPGAFRLPEGWTVPDPALSSVQPHYMLAPDLQQAYEKQALLNANEGPSEDMGASRPVVENGNQAVSGGARTTTHGRARRIESSLWVPPL